MRKISFFNNEEWSSFNYIIVGALCAVASIILSAIIVFIFLWINGRWNSVESTTPVADTEIVEDTTTLFPSDTTAAVVIIDDVTRGSKNKDDAQGKVDTKEQGTNHKIVKQGTNKIEKETDVIVSSKKERISTKVSKLPLSYGSYEGEVVNGYPEGKGKLTYTTTRVINRYDKKQRKASPGDYVEGQFTHGFFSSGKHYSSDGTLVGTLMIGEYLNGYEDK